MIIPNDANSIAVNLSLTDDDHILLQQTQGNDSQYIVLSYTQLQRILLECKGARPFADTRGCPSNCTCKGTAK